MPSALPEPERDRDGVLAALSSACETHPEHRVMQVIVNALGNDPFYVEDRDAVVALYAYAREGRF